MDERADPRLARTWAPDPGWLARLTDVIPALPRYPLGALRRQPHEV